MANLAPLTLSGARTQHVQAADTHFFPSALMVGGTGVPVETLTTNGVLALQSHVSPTDTAGYGKVFVKADKKLYYRNQDGVEFDLASSTVAIGDAITAATAGSVLFAGVAGILAQDNAHLFWDDTNNRLQVGSVLNPASWTFAVIPSGSRDGVGVYAGGAAPDDYPTMSFLRFRGTLALPTTVLTGDILGRLAFSAHNGSTFDGGGSDGGFIGVASQNWSAFNIGTKYQIRPIPTGTSVALNGFEVSGEAVVVNPDGVNLDFRVASDTQTHALFLDANLDTGFGRWGVFTASPTAKLHVNNGTSTDAIFKADDEATTVFTIADGATAITFGTGLDRDASGTYAIGGTNITTLSLGRSGQTQALLGAVTHATTLVMTTDSTYTPTTDNTGKVGTGANRFAEVHAVTVTTGDLEMKSPQDDGASAHWKLQEERDRIVAFNVLTGKRYALALTEIVA